MIYDASAFLLYCLPQNNQKGKIADKSERWKMMRTLVLPSMRPSPAGGSVVINHHYDDGN
jgi:hypothetical protein